jgi:hypothetical protein
MKGKGPLPRDRAVVGVTHGGLKAVPFTAIISFGPEGALNRDVPTVKTL